MSKCTFGDGVVIKPDGVNELDPCVYKEIQRVKNVTVVVSECAKCGHIELMWLRQEDSEELPIGGEDDGEDA